MARSDRRRLARALLAGIPASLLLARAASAQPAVGAPWPMCASATQSYCIAAATRDGEPTDGPGNGPYEGGVLVPYAVLTDANTVSWGMKWNLDESSMPGSIGGSILSMTIRSGNIEPLYTAARAMGFHLDGVQGSAADASFQFTVTGSSIVADWQVNSGNCFTNPDSCANDDITADVKRRLFSGFTDNMAGFSDAQKALFGGMYVSTNAQYVQRIPDTTKPGDGSSSWSIKLANPHKDIAGNTTFGEMTAFVPSVYFQTQAGISGETAASQGMVVQAITTVWKPDATGQWKPNDIYTPVTSGSKAMNGGVYTRVTRLGYSAPKVVFNTKTGFLAGSDVPNYVPPDPPIMTGLSQASGIVTISYKPPYFDGNSPITSFKGYCEQNKIMYSNTIEQGYSRAVAVAGMQEGRVYCWVKARNAGGESLESETVSIDVGGVPPVFTEPAKGTSSVWMPPGQSTAAAASSTKTAAATTSSAAATTTSAAPAPVATSTKLAATTSPSTSGASDGIVSKFAVCLLGALMAVIGMAL